MSANNTKYVAFLRGINVSGHNKVPMKDLQKEINHKSYNKIDIYLTGFLRNIINLKKIKTGNYHEPIDELQTVRR